MPKLSWHLALLLFVVVSWVPLPSARSGSVVLQMVIDPNPGLSKLAAGKSLLIYSEVNGYLFQIKEI